MKKEDLIYVAGHTGMVGSAIIRKLLSLDFQNILTAASSELDLRSQVDVDRFINQNKPKYVFLAAAKVGGIYANKNLPAQFLYDNIMIQSNVIHAAYNQRVEKLLFLGSSCIYPKESPQPISEDSLLTGPLEPTNAAYAIAKIAGIKMCDAYRQQYGCNFISAMPTNLFGPNDNYDLQSSHVLPALLRKFIEATRANKPQVKVWGSGRPLREFLHVDDLASAAIFLMQNYDQPGPINVGTGKEVSIARLAEIIKTVAGFKGDIVFDRNMPDGMMRKRLDVQKINQMGWSANISLEEGINAVYRKISDVEFDQKRI